MQASPLNNQKNITSPNHLLKKIPEYVPYEIKDTFKPIMADSIPIKPYNFNHTNEIVYDQISKPNNIRSSKSLLKPEDVLILISYFSYTIG